MSKIKNNILSVIKMLDAINVKNNEIFSLEKKIEQYMPLHAIAVGEPKTTNCTINTASRSKTAKRTNSISIAVLVSQTCLSHISIKIHLFNVLVFVLINVYRILF